MKNSTDELLDEIFIPIALKSGTVRPDGTRTEEFDNWDAIIREAKQSIEAYIKKEKLALLAEVEKIIGRGSHVSKEHLSHDDWVAQEATNILRATQRAELSRLKEGLK